MKEFFEKLRKKLAKQMLKLLVTYNEWKHKKSVKRFLKIAWYLFKIIFGLLVKKVLENFIS